MVHGKIDLSDVRMVITVFESLDYDNGDWDEFCAKHAQ